MNSPSRVLTQTEQGTETKSASRAPSSAIAPPEVSLSRSSDASLDGTQLLQQLLERRSLSIEQSAALMQAWLVEDEIPPVLSGAILAALQAKGIAADELVGMVRVLQAQSLQVQSLQVQSLQVQSHAATLPASTPSRPNPILPATVPPPLIDTCGTGGDGASTFNISTAVAFVAAAAGIKVAKHGNRSVSSRVGSADVLEALGIRLSAPIEQVQAAVDQVGITFLFAPGWHPAFKSIAPLRKTLKVRTVFNLLGPLLNPLRPTGQVIGVYHTQFLETIAQALAQLGIDRAIVLHGRENLDEAGLADLTDLAILSDRQIQRFCLDPKSLGLRSAPTSALQGGSVADNAAILQAVLQGKGSQAQQDVVALNAALALQVSGISADCSDYQTSIAANLAIAQDVLRSGRAWEKLQQLGEFLRG